MQQGSFPHQGKKREEAALGFWKRIKREHPFECEIEKILVDGEDITQLVKDLE